MTSREDMPRSLIIPPAVLGLCAAIYFSFALQFPEWYFLPLMWLAHVALFLALVTGAFALRFVCLRIGLKGATATRLCIVAQAVAFIAAMSVPPT
ncbi:hypothetical protein [Candidatus Palauibacter sp.]|uniref:hypothetical protein n=1 Tax=Candidatus Palauibacter sp. TaxID=3101350 RepID=UPI003B01F950